MAVICVMNGTPGFSPGPAHMLSPGPACESWVVLFVLRSLSEKVQHSWADSGASFWIEQQGVSELCQFSLLSLEVLLLENQCSMSRS